jgi:hypothetical protein
VCLLGGGLALQILIALFGFVSPWLGLFSLVQLPLIPLMRLRVFRGKRLGNLVVWFGLVTGVPLIAVLYSLQYCANGNCQSGHL